MNRQHLVPLLGILILLALVASPALGDETAGAAAAAEASKRPEGAGQALAAVLLSALLVAGVGCVLAIIRLILPGPVGAADDALARLGTGRLVLTGILPIVGGALLGHAAHASGSPVLGGLVAVVVVLPLLLAAVLGACAAVPHLGAGLLRDGAERSLLARAVVGALVLGLACATLVFLLRHAASIPLALVLGWFTGAGLGLVFRPRAPEAEVGESEGGE